MSESRACSFVRPPQRGFTAQAMSEPAEAGEQRDSKRVSAPHRTALGRACAKSVQRGKPEIKSKPLPSLASQTITALY